MLKPTAHLFVCGAVPPSEGQSCRCDPQVALELVNYLREEVAERKMNGVRVTACECQDLCEHGPVVIVYPSGFWYRQVDKAAVGRILDMIRSAAVNKMTAGCAGCHG